MSTSDGPNKSYALFILLLLILAVGLANQFWPRTPTISNEAIQGIQKATEQLERVADNVERSTLAMTDLNKALVVQMRNRTSTDDTGYDKLLQEYGINVQSVGPLSGAGLSSGLQQRYQDIGSGYVSASSGTTNSAGQLQKPSEGSASRIDGSAAGTTQPSSGNAGKPPQ